MKKIEKTAEEIGEKDKEMEYFDIILKIILSIIVPLVLFMLKDTRDSFKDLSGSIKELSEKMGVISAVVDMKSREIDKIYDSLINITTVSYDLKGRITILEEKVRALECQK